MADLKRLISAEKVYEMGHRTPFHIGIADLCDLKELLADVPTVDAVEVVHGRWLKARKPITTNMECSVCHKQYLLSDHNYCPNCGAKMDGGKDE